MKGPDSSGPFLLCILIVYFLLHWLLSTVSGWVQRSFLTHSRPGSIEVITSLWELSLWESSCKNNLVVYREDSPGNRDQKVVEIKKGSE